MNMPEALSMSRTRSFFPPESVSDMDLQLFSESEEGIECLLCALKFANDCMGEKGASYTQYIRLSQEDCGKGKTDTLVCQNYVFKTLLL